MSTESKEITKVEAQATTTSAIAIAGSKAVAEAQKGSLSRIFSGKMIAIGGLGGSIGVIGTLVAWLATAAKFADVVALLGLVANAVMAVGAWAALSMWRRQLKGQTAHNVALDILENSQLLMDQIDQTVMLAETSKVFVNDGQLEIARKNMGSCVEGVHKAHDRMWKPVWRMRAVWGRDVYQAVVHPLMYEARKLTSVIISCQNNFWHNPLPKHWDGDDDKRIWAALRGGKEEKDAWLGECRAHMGRIEEWAAPHVKA